MCEGGYCRVELCVVDETLVFDCWAGDGGGAKGAMEELGCLVTDGLCALRDRVFETRSDRLRASGRLTRLQLGQPNPYTTTRFPRNRPNV